MFKLEEDQQKTIISEYDVHFPTNLHLLTAHKKCVLNMFASFIDDVFKYAHQRGEIAIAKDMMSFLQTVTASEDPNAPAIQKELKTQALKFKENNFLDYSNTETLQIYQLGCEINRYLPKWKTFCAGEPVTLQLYFKLQNVVDGPKIEGTNINTSLTGEQNKEVQLFLGFALEKISLQVQKHLANNQQPKGDNIAALANAPAPIAPSAALRANPSQLMAETKPFSFTSVFNFFQRLNPFQSLPASTKAVCNNPPPTQRH